LKVEEGEILQSILQSLLRDFNRIENRLVLNEENDEKLAKYVNAKQRTSKSILDCISMIRDPKFVTVSDSQKNDIASMIARLKRAGIPNNNSEDVSEKHQLITTKDSLSSNSPPLGHKDRSNYCENTCDRTTTKYGQGRRRR
jgi:hypothetical protein